MKSEPGIYQMEEKIGGYDAYKVRNDADTCIKAKELELGDPKYYKVVAAEVVKKAEAAMEAAKTKGEAADMVKLEKKTGERMKKTFKTGSHNSHNGGGEY